jgi:hypothetical protein
VTAVSRDVISRSQALDYLDVPDGEFDRIAPLDVSVPSRQAWSTRRSEGAWFQDST